MKLKFFNQVEQAFRPLCMSNSHLSLKLNFNVNSLVNISSPIYWEIIYRTDPFSRFAFYLIHPDQHQNILDPPPSIFTDSTFNKILRKVIPLITI